MYQVDCTSYEAKYIFSRDCTYRTDSSSVEDISQFIEGPLDKSYDLVKCRYVCHREM